jgi:enterochelin esterase-like enzyme
MEQIDESGLFHYTLNLREPVRLEPKFIVDGEWKLDPLCPGSVDNGIGGRNSYFVVGEFREPPELEEVEGFPHGRVEEFEFASERLGNRRAVHVYLPPTYDANPAQLPALYVHDGGEYLRRARLPVVPDNLIHAGAVAPLVTVMVDPVGRAIVVLNKDRTSAQLCDLSRLGREFTGTSGVENISPEARFDPSAGTLMGMIETSGVRVVAAR